VIIGGVPVDAGDVVVCDRTGVVVVRRAEIEATLSALERVLEREAAEAERVAAGQVVADAVRALLESDRVRIVD
jgi:regulator of RNase E activity RraA